jgi:hypothetical protein
MPFDGRENNVALNRAILVDALRRQLPENFQWDFNVVQRTTRCGTAGCAIGLARIVGILPQDFNFTYGRIEPYFGDTGDLFHCKDVDGIVPRYGVSVRQVTPSMVADALERL